MSYRFFRIWEPRGWRHRGWRIGCVSRTGRLCAKACDNGALRRGQRLRHPWFKVAWIPSERPKNSRRPFRFDVPDRRSKYNATNQSSLENL